MEKQLEIGIFGFVKITENMQENLLKTERESERKLTLYQTNEICPLLDHVWNHLEVFFWFPNGTYVLLLVEVENLQGF